MPRNDTTLRDGACVRCGNDLDSDDQRCQSCGLTDPRNPASAVWLPLGTWK